MSNNIFITGGGTGGHLMPAIAISELLNDAGYKPIIFTDERCKEYIPKNLPFECNIQKLIRPNSVKNFFKFFMDIGFLVRENWNLINIHKPKALIACGGYTSLPLLLVCIIKKIPIMLHEQNSVIGRANYIFSIFARKLFLSFIHTVNIPIMASTDIIWTGTPALKKHKFSCQKKFVYEKNFRIIVTGGSQGASIFDELILDTMKKLTEKYRNIKFEIVQQTREKDPVKIREKYSKMGVVCEVQNFFHDLETHYATADLFIGRSGASTINEIILYELPSIFIPYPHAKDNHQYYNAKNLYKFNAADMIEQKDITPDALFQKIARIIDAPEIAQKLSEQLSRLKIDTDKIIVEEIKKVIDN